MPGGTVKYSIVADAKPFVDATAQASKELGKLTDQAVGSAGSLGSIAAAAGPMGKALAVATGLGVAGFAALGAAVADSIKGLVETGGKLADLSAQTGISTQALQKLAYAGSLVGVSQEAITGAAVKMEKALANGDSVFQRLGLSVQKLRAMQPDQAFAAIAAQIAQIKDPSLQAAAAMEVFGKSGATLLPLIKSDLKAAGEEAERLGIILSDKTVSAADALGDEATKLAAAWDGVKNQFAAAIIQNPAILSALQGLVTKLGDISQALIKNKDVIGGWVSTWVGAIEEIGRAFSRIANNPVFQKLVMGGASVIANFLQIPALAAGVGMLGQGGGGRTTGQQSGRYGSSAARSGGGADGGLSFTSKGAQAAADAAAKAWQDASEKARKADDAFVAHQKDNAYQQMLGIQNLFDKRGKAHAKELDDELRAEYAHRDKLLKLGEDNEKIFAEAERRKKETQLQGLAAVGEALQSVGGKVGFVGEMVSGFANVSLQMMSAKTNTEKFTVALQAAADIYNAGFQSKSTGKGALQGAAKGAAVGTAIMPGWGTAIGTVAGAAIGIFGAKKGQAAELKELRGELAELEKAAAAAGISFQHAFDTKNAAGLKRAIEEIKHALDTQDEAQQKLNDAIERYGFTIEELGPAMQRQRLDEMAGQLYQDYQLLIASGIEQNDVIARMGPAINDYVNTAVAAGEEIPAAMKPIIDKMIEQGLLLDENGNAYGSAEEAGITYAQTMSQMFEDLISKVDELVSALLGIPNKTVTVNVKKNDPNGLLGGGGGGDDGGGDGGDEGRGYASGGVFEPRPGGHLIRVAEGGQREWVLNPQQMAAMAGGGGGPQQITIPVSIGGQQLDEVIMRRTRGGYIRVS